jgi:hypothetical protein
LREKGNNRDNKLREVSIHSRPKQIQTLLHWKILNLDQTILKVERIHLSLRKIKIIPPNRDIRGRSGGER